MYTRCLPRVVPCYLLDFLPYLVWWCNFQVKIFLPNFCTFRFGGLGHFSPLLFRLLFWCFSYLLVLSVNLKILLDIRQLWCGFKNLKSHMSTFAPEEWVLLFSHQLKFFPWLGKANRKWGKRCDLPPCLTWWNRQGNELVDFNDQIFNNTKRVLYRSIHQLEWNSGQLRFSQT